MADISKYLQDILSAVYGEEVRGSIHDAIEIINEASEVVLSTGTAITGPTSSSEGFFTGSLYLNLSTMELWKCIGTNSWQSQGVTKGADGKGIASIDKTATAGLVDTYTITYTDGTTDTYDVTNGANGADGKDGSTWYKGTALSGTGTAITGFPGNLNDFYLNSTSGNVYICTKAGGTLPPDAAEWEYVMTLTGGGGGTITVIDHLNSTSSTDALSANQGRALNEKKQEKFASYSAGLKEEMVGPAGSQTLQLSLDLLAGSNISLEEKNGKIEINSTGGSGGLLPYFYIDSEAGATVTVTAPDGSTITPTAAGSGHWECKVPMYGVYTIHSVLAGQGDATINVTVDDVKEYHITDTHYDHTVSFVAPSGSTVRIEGGTEIYTLTGTGSTQTQAVHSASTSFTVTATMDGNGKPYTFTTPSTTGQTTTIPSGTFDFGTINVTVAQDFVTTGSTITCALSPYNTITKTAASSLTFRVPSTGSWTISGTIGSDVYYTSPNPVVVNNLNTPVSADLQTVPDGKTVTPTDVIQTWLNCAGIYDKTSYTTLDDVLGDATTLLALMSDNNAVDYLVRSKAWAGRLVPTMTSDTLPQGKAFTKTEASDGEAFKAFDNDSATSAKSPTLESVAGWFLGYIFDTPQKPTSLVCKGETGYQITWKVQVSSDTTTGSDGTWYDTSTTFNTSSSIGEVTVPLNLSAAVKAIRITSTAVGGATYFNISKLQFIGTSLTDDSTAMTDIGANNYCADTLLDDADWCNAIVNSTYFESVLNAKVPTMTSNTEPTGYGVAYGYGSFTADQYWSAFNSTSVWAGQQNTNNVWVGFNFNVPRRVFKVTLASGTYAQRVPFTYKYQASNDENFTTIGYESASETITTVDTTRNTNVDTLQKYKYHRMLLTSITAYATIAKVNFYGREDV